VRVDIAVLAKGQKRAVKKKKKTVVRAKPKGGDEGLAKKKKPTRIIVGSEGLHSEICIN